VLKIFNIIYIKLNLVSIDTKLLNFYKKLD